MNYSKEEIENVICENQLLRDITKDLRTPLNAISGYVTLLMKYSDNPDKVMEYAHNIGLSCQDLLVMCSQAQEFRSGISMERTEVSNSEFALGQMLKNAVDIAQSWTQYKHLEFEYTVSGIENDIFFGDRIMIAEVLRNLLYHAGEVTPEGGKVSLKVSGLSEAEPGRCNISFSVRDGGPGLSAEIIKRIFDGTNDESGQGSVPGSIAMVRNFVNMMGGTISVQSTPGKGTTFTVGLQLGIVDHTSEDFWREHGVKRVLVVCEDPRETERICNLLSSTGLETTAASSGYFATRVITQADSKGECLDLILLDRDIQDQVYTKFVRGLQRSNLIRVPVVIVMSAKAEHFTNEVHKAGVARIMPKPFFYSTFRSIVEELDLGNGGETAAETKTAGNPLEGQRILVAENSAYHANVVRELFEVEGARCEIAGNGKAAVAMFRSSRPGYYDTIMMDVRMPVSDGYAAAAEIRGLSRSDAKKIPILAMVDDPSEIDENKAGKSCITAFCSKPPDVQEINQILSSVS